MDELKILLVDGLRINITTEDSLFSLGLISLGSHAKAEVSCKVNIIRLQDIRVKYEVDPEDEIAIFISKVMDEKPDLVCFSTNYMDQFFSLELAKRVKEKTGALIVFGGCNPTLIDECMLKSFDFVDLVFRGEAERTFVKFCKELADMKKAGQSLEKINVISSCTLAGVSYLNEDGQLKRNEHPGMIPDINSLSYLDPELLRLYPRVRSSKSMILEYSRGCPFNCSFCSAKLVWTRTCRKKSVNRMIEEIKYYHDTLGVTDFEFADDNFFSDPNTRLDALSKINKLGFVKKLLLHMRFSSLSEEIVDQLNQFDKVKIFFGIETASPSVLKDMNKGMSMDLVNDKMSLLEDSDRFQYGFGFIIGYPTETDDDLNQTLEFVLHLKKQLPKSFIEMQHIIYDVNTPLTNKYQENLVQFAQYPFEDHISPEIREGAQNPLFFQEFLCPDFRQDKQDREFFYRLMFSNIAATSAGCAFFDSLLGVLGKRPVELLNELYAYICQNHDIDFFIEDWKFKTCKDIELSDPLIDILFSLLLEFLDSKYPEVCAKIGDYLGEALMGLTNAQYFLLFKYICEKNADQFLGMPITTVESMPEKGSTIISSEIAADEMGQRIAELESLSEEEKNKILLAFFTVKYPDNIRCLFYFGPKITGAGYFEKPIRRVISDIPDNSGSGCKTFKGIIEDIELQTIVDSSCSSSSCDNKH